VVEPQFGESWNPYSHVLNNPFSYVDPSGFSAIEVKPEPKEEPPPPPKPIEVVWHGVKRPNLDDRLPLVEGKAVGATPAPVDVGVHGNASGYVPPTASAPELDTLSLVLNHGLALLWASAQRAKHRSRT
jgi:hypothetical protein